MPNEVDIFAQLLAAAQDRMDGAKLKEATELVSNIKQQLTEQAAVTAITGLKPGILDAEQLHLLETAGIAAQLNRPLTPDQMELLGEIACRQIGTGRKIVHFVANRLPNSEYWLRAIGSKLRETE